MKCARCFFTDAEVSDEICRRCSRNFTRGELIEVIGLGLIYLLICRFSLYLFTGDFFTHPLRGGLFNPTRVSDVFVFPINLSEHPWHVLTVGWTYALVIVMPVLIGAFYGAASGMVVAAVGGYHVEPPLLAVMVVLGALISGTRARYLASFRTSLVLGTLPAAAVLFVSSLPGCGGKAGIASLGPWVAAVLLIAGCLPLAMWIARLRDYNTTFLAWMMGLQLAAVLVLCQGSVGFARMEYEFVRRSHWAAGARFRVVVAPADAAHPPEAQRAAARSLFEERRSRSLEAFSRFISWFPRSPEASLALYERAEIRNMIPYFAGTIPDGLRVITRRITPEAFEDYRTIQNDFSDSLAAIPARLNVARYHLQHNQLGNAAQELEDLVDFLDVKVPLGYRPTGADHAQLGWRSDRMTNEELDRFRYEVLQETRTELRFLERNSDYNQIPLRLFYQLDEHDAGCDAELAKILKWFRDSKLADNIELILMERSGYKLEDLEKLLARYPKGDAAPRMLLLLGEGYRDRSAPDRAEGFLRKLTAEFPDSPEAARAAVLLESLKGGLGKAETQ